MTDKSKQLSFNVDQPQTDNGPVVCLGMTFKNDDERREFFRNELRKKLPELKKIEGFPIGDDEDIIALSDPPYYTACPNPWINDFIEEWEKEKVTKYGRNANEEYHREPFASDVSEGKNDPIYNAHSYHTKVPHKAIMHYLLNYTKPGDIVLDGFAGSGMTGVACEMCDDKETLESLGYRIDSNGNVYREEHDSSNKPFSQIGKRNSILNDLSPAATFIANNYNSSLESEKFIQIAENIMIDAIKKFGWLYTTLNTEDEKIIKQAVTDIKNSTNFEELSNTIQKYKEYTCKVNLTVWSDVYLCKNCTREIIYWDSAVDQKNKKILTEFTCPHCNAILKKNSLNKARKTFVDYTLNKTLNHAKQVPVSIKYTFNRKRYEKKPGEFDLALINAINDLRIPYEIPISELPAGYNTKQPKESHGLTHVHHFYTKRNLLVLSYLHHQCSKLDYEYREKILWILTGIDTISSRLLNYRISGSGKPTPLKGTLYLSSLYPELNVIDMYRNKYKLRIAPILKGDGKNSVIQTGSNEYKYLIDNNSIDYIFIDPPFGSNLMYSELNIFWESWLNVRTNNRPEAIINNVQGKDMDDYKNLMLTNFKELYRVLKPGRWMTVEFSNSKASVWNAIQDAIQKAGFVIANVSALDKKQGSFKAVTTTTAVKQDLVISAYKPKKEDIDRMEKMKNTEESVWTFVNQHLQQLPVFEGQKGEAKIIAERTPRILFDRMVAYFVQNGLPVPLSSGEFQEGVAQRYPMRDGMAFLESQVAEYDKKRTLVKEFTQLNLFVTDENSAIEWIRQQLLKKPQTRQDLHPEFMKQIQHIAKHEELPELDDLLEQNFLRYDGEEPVPNQILTYLRRNYKDLRGLDPTDPKVIEKAMHRWYVPDPNKQSDLEKLREKALLREFNQYKDELEGNRKKLRTFRTEAIRAGFKNAYKEKDFETIVKIGDRIPEKVIQEDDKLFMFYENAKIRLGL